MRRLPATKQSCLHWASFEFFSWLHQVSMRSQKLPVTAAIAVLIVAFITVTTLMKKPIAAPGMPVRPVSWADPKAALGEQGPIPSSLSFQNTSVETRAPGEERVRERLSGVTIPFIENSGQTKLAVAYYAPTFAGTVFVTREGQIVYSLPGEKVFTSGDPKIGDSPSKERVSASSSRKSPGRNGGWTLTETVVGGKAHPSTSDRAAAQVSYFLGNDPARWRSGLPTFEGVSLGKVWPGISLELRARGKNVEKLFTVEPGGDPSRIRLGLAGARRLRVNDAGALVVATGLGEVTFTPPAAFQERQGVRHSIGAAYELHGREYGFRLSDYDPALPVLIDPLLQATYLGGNHEDIAYALAIHPMSGDVYAAGYTDSTNFPGTAGGAQPVGDVNRYDAFVARLNSALTTLVQATYLGGGTGHDDFGRALAIDGTTGDVYVAGQTFSPNFPGTAGGAQAVCGGNSCGAAGDAFVARLNSALTILQQATFLGGTVGDEALALAIHPTTGDVYVAGQTTATDFPGTTGGAQAAIGGICAPGCNADGFVAHLNSALTTLYQATYLGGSGNETAYDLALHPATGEVYVAGNTNSSNLPGAVGGAQAVYGGGVSDAFIARLNSTLTTLVQTTYLGGSGPGSANCCEIAYALAIHPTTGDVYVAGQTLSTNFPGTTGGAQASNGGFDDAFIARLNPALTKLVQSTNLGGSGQDDTAYALAIHPATGQVYVTGDTNSSNFPGTTGGAQASNGGFDDAFIARLNPALTTLVQATYLGGNSIEQANALAIHPTTGDVYVAGQTLSTNFPGTAGGAQPAHATDNGSTDAFVARLTADLAAGPSAAPAMISGTITDANGSPLGGVVMRLNGVVSRITITDANGNYHFDNVDTDQFYTVTPSLANYSFSPANRSFSLVGNKTDAAFTANPDSSPTANAIDTTEYFMREHYLDFLGREPDQGGVEYWSIEINQCNGDDACIRNRRIDVSAAFFASPEFQQTGSYIYELYAGALGRTPRYEEFMPDRSQVVGGPNLDVSKVSFADVFVQRPEFTAKYPQTMTREEFVDALIQTMTTRSGADLSSLRSTMLTDYDTGGRSLVVRHAVQTSAFAQAEYNKAFVLFEYFGYLRRNPDIGGYGFWLDVLNGREAGNYRGMVCAFITSAEYQRRFSMVVTHSNTECGQ
jgi:hypothetical protein